MRNETTARLAPERATSPGPMRAVRLGAAVGGLAQSLTGAAGALLAHQVSGSEAAAGLPQTALVAGAVISAATASRLAASFGRRRVMAAGAVAAVIGSALVAAGAAETALVPILAGFAMLGSGTAVVMLCRYAAAELVPESDRAKAMSSVLVATTVGAVAGPNLLAPAGAAAEAVGLAALIGPFVFGVVGFALTALILGAGMADAPRPEPDRDTPRAGSVPISSAAPALAVLALSNLVMVAVMTMAPVRMGHFHASLSLIGLVVSLHVAGMFAPSPLSARLVDRIGAPRTAVLGSLVMASSCLAATVLDGSALGMAVTMTGLGVGWNLGLVSGSAMLTASLPREVRLRREGTGEVGMGLAAATGGIACGPVAAWGGYGLLAVGGAAAAGLIAAIVRRVDSEG
ncbi:MFS transporter [Glycomyces salinus]|uniref:MFS transporter n=1 Tax=Glycomyces salinus TaxID=980294 RepID=UPI0018ED80D1|nr:MFS transporter [Glycomyces salinus]